VILITKEKDFDLLIIAILFISAAILSLIFRLPYLIMPLLYMGAPALYLTIRLKDYSKKIAIETLVFSLVVTTIIDYLATISNSWIESTLFKFKVLNIIPIEAYIFAFIYNYLNISFYAYFFDRYKTKHFGKRIYTSIVLVCFSLLLFSSILLVAKDNSVLIIRYFYSYLALIFIGIIILGYTRHPKLYKRYILGGVFLIIPWLIHEIVSLILGHWSFPQGYHLFYISFFSTLVPVEEFIWIIFVTPVLLGLHEYFSDNLKN